MDEENNGNKIEAGEEKTKFRRKSPQEIFSLPSKLRVAMMIVCGLTFVLLWVAFFLTLGGIMPDPHNRMFTYAMTSLLMLAPYIIEMAFGVKFSDFILTFFVVYAFLAAVLGAAFALYQTVPYFDKAIHALFGYVGCVVGLLVVCKLSDYDKLTPFFVATVCFAVSLACGAVWEILEFSADIFFGQTAQGKPVDLAGGGTGVLRDDTMLDIVCNFCGAVVFIIHYVIHVMSRRNLVMGSIIRDLKKKN